MIDFFGNLLVLLVQFISCAIDTLVSIVEFIPNAINYINDLLGYSQAGMVAVRELITAVPSPVLAVYGACIVVILLLAVIKLFM